MYGLLMFCRTFSWFLCAFPFSSQEPETRQRDR